MLQVLPLAYIFQLPALLVWLAPEAAFGDFQGYHHLRKEGKRCREGEVFDRTSSLCCFSWFCACLGLQVCSFAQIVLASSNSVCFRCFDTALF